MNLQHEPLILFAVGFLFFYKLVIDYDPKAVFFLAVTCIVIYYILRDREQKVLKSVKAFANFITEKEDLIKNDTNREVESRLYSMIHIPSKLTYIKQCDEAQSILQSLKFLDVYDIELFKKIIIHLEVFLKLHYKIMMGKKDYTIHRPILLELRVELLNLIQSIYFTIPRDSTLYRNIEQDLERGFKRMIAFTFKYVQILAHKYGGYVNETQGPRPNDSLNDIIFV